MSPAGLVARGNSFADQVEEALRRQIVSGARQPGARLNEVEIAAELGVSRGPVREAMQRLSRDGLVHVEPHRGAFVRRLDADEIRALFQVRVPLECTAAGLAAGRRTDQDISRLRRLIDSTAQEVSRQPSPHYPTSLDFHELIAVVSGNDRLERLVVQINQELRLVRATSGFRPDRAQVALDEHTGLLSAIESGDQAAAQARMAAHLAHSLDNTLRILLLQAEDGAPSPALSAS